MKCVADSPQAGTRIQEHIAIARVLYDTQECSEALALPCVDIRAAYRQGFGQMGASSCELQSGPRVSIITTCVLGPGLYPNIMLLQSIAIRNKNTVLHIQ